MKTTNGQKNFVLGGKKHNGFETSKWSATSRPNPSWQMSCQGGCSLKAVSSVTSVD